MNSISLVGRAGKDPVSRQAGEHEVVETTIAVQGFKKDDTTWVKLVAWNKTGEILGKYVKKGDQVAVTGRLEKPEAWINKQSGEANAALVVTVSNLTLIGSKQDSEASSAPPPPKPKAAAGSAADCPF